MLILGAMHSLNPTCHSGLPKLAALWQGGGRLPLMGYKLTKNGCTEFSNYREPMLISHLEINARIQFKTTLFFKYILYT